MTLRQGSSGPGEVGLFTWLRRRLARDRGGERSAEQADRLARQSPGGQEGASSSAGEPPPRDSDAGQRLAGRVALASVLTVLPGLLVLLQFASSRTDLKLLLFPPLAAIGYQVLRAPDSRLANVRGIVVGPVLGAVCGTALSQAGGLQVWTTAAAVLGGVVIVEVLRAHAPPILAIVLLPLFFGVPGWIYPPSVFAATLVLYGVLLIWRRFLHRLRAAGRE